jgi:hypothetical protein
MVANDVDLIINASHSIDPFENIFQQSLEIKCWNSTPHVKYITTAINLKPIATAAKMGVPLECLPRSKARVAPCCRLLSLSFLY